MGDLEKYVYDTEFVRAYSEKGLWDKILECCKTAGCEAVRAALLLFYAAARPDVPVKARAVIVGALGYFILPVDAIPDMLPLVGYTDDVAVMGAALAVVAAHIDAGVKAQAAEKLRDWFGEGAC